MPNNTYNEKAEANNFELLKTIALSATFFCIIGSYSILRPLKTSVFFSLVGKEYQPITKYVTILSLIPILLLYAKIVDSLKRYQVVYVFLILYSFLALLFAYLLTNPSIGLQNTSTSPNRILGWIFYLFIDLFAPLVVSTFWAFVNSINSPQNARKSYGIIVAVSRVAGIITPSLSWLLLNTTKINPIQIIPLLVVTTSFLLTSATFLIRKITKKVPIEYLESYEEKHTHTKKKNKKSGILDGLILMIKQPYVLGIFALTYSFEIVSVIIDYQMQVLMSIANNNSIGGMSSYMFLYTATFQALAFVFAVFGTSNLLKKIGTQKCLLIMPISVIALMGSLLFLPNLTTIFIIMVVLRSLHYGFNAPVRETLYIPTTKDVKFKSKTWIDAFGKRLSKASGSTFNLWAQSPNYISTLKLDSLFSIGIATTWTVISIMVGKKYTETIENHEIIGEEKNIKLAKKTTMDLEQIPKEKEKQPNQIL